MKNNWQVVLAGEGGQGLILAGRILSEAAIIDGHNVSLTSTYGIAARGGYSEAQVVISEQELYYPKCLFPDLVLALTQQAYDRYAESVSNDCLIIYDSKDVTNGRGKNEIGFDFKEALLTLGNLKVINSLFLGVILQKLNIVSRESMVKALEKNLPPKIQDINLKAFNYGLENQ